MTAERSSDRKLRQESPLLPFFYNVNLVVNFFIFSIELLCHTSRDPIYLGPQTQPRAAACIVLFATAERSSDRKPRQESPLLPFFYNVNLVVNFFIFSIELLCHTSRDPIYLGPQTQPRAVTSTDTFAAAETSCDREPR